MTKFVVSRQLINEAGHPEFEFSQRPYVHSTLHHAEQMARQLSRRHQQPFAVFEKVSEADCTTESLTVMTVDHDALANRLAEIIRERGFATEIETARRMVLTALKTVDLVNKE